MMTDIEQIQDALGEFWEEYVKDHDVDKNIMVMVIDMSTSIHTILGQLADMFISHRMSQREHLGTSALQPEVTEDE